MTRVTFLAIALLFCLSATAAQAATYVDESGDIHHEKKTTKKFTLGGEGKQELRLTLSADSNKSGSGTMRVYFYKRSPQGGWDQIDHLRIQINGSQKQTSDTFKLPPGEYMCQIKARRVKYTFKLEDA